MEKLLNKLDVFLAAQPEWYRIFIADRGLRKKAAKEIAKRITTIPKVGDTERHFEHRDPPAPMEGRYTGT